MDYDYIEDDRPRFQLASGPAVPEDERKLDIRQIVVCASAGFFLVGYGWLIGSSVMQFIAYWLGVALIVGPFAPISYTGGDCRVGVGELLPPEENIEPSSAESDRRHSGRKRQESNLTRVQSKESLQAVPESRTQGTVDEGLKSRENAKAVESGSANGATDFVRDEEWTVADLELLRKHMAKHPRGTARRWDVISEVFQGSHSVESVIKMAKALTEQKPADDDSYAKFLSQRKGFKVDIDSPLSQREEANAAMQREGRVANGVADSEPTDAGKGKSLLWNEESDKALLIALKVFPKDSPMRWDKIAAAVPGKSKAQCFRRYADLRESFRHKKGGTVPNPDAD